MAYTLNGVAARIQEMDFEASAWKRYVGLCTLAHIRGTEKKTLETKVFGTDKPSSNFKGAWTISKNLYSAGMSESIHRHIADLNLDDALKAAMDALANHMMALGVNGKNTYAAVAHYADKAALDAALAKAAADKAADEEEEKAKVTEDASGDAPAETPLEPVDVVAAAKALIDGMTMEEMNAIAIYLTERMTNLQTATVAA